MRALVALLLLATACKPGTLGDPLVDSGSDISTDTGSDTGSDSASDTSTAGTLVQGDPCGGDLGACGPDLSCCYPCGIPGCADTCEPTCNPAEPACSGGCYLYP